MFDGSQRRGVNLENLSKEKLEVELRPQRPRKGMRDPALKENRDPKRKESNAKKSHPSSEDVSSHVGIKSEIFFYLYSVMPKIKTI